MSRRAVLVAVLLAAISLIGAGQPGARVATRAAAPRFCKPVKKAFHDVVSFDSRAPNGYKRAYRTAATNLRKAAKSAPKRVREPLRQVAERYQGVVEGESIELGEVSGLAPEMTEIRNAVSVQCGFTIDTGPPSS